MQVDRQLTTEANNEILNINKPSRNNYLADETRLWKVLLKGGDEVYLTRDELEFYLREKERGATHVMFEDFGISTDYRLFAKNEKLISAIAKRKQDEAEDRKQDEIVNKFTPEQRAKNFEKYKDLKFKFLHEKKG